LRSFRPCRSLGRGSHDHLGRRQRRCVARAEYKRRPFPTWTDDDLAAFEQHWPSGTRARLAYALLLYTGQRRSDVIRMGWQHVKDGRLAVVQQKTGARVLIPIHPALSAELHAIPTAQMTFLMTATGAGFASGTAFYNWFTDCARAAGIEGKSPHGMRKACARRLIEAGCTPHQAAPSVLWADNAELRQCRRCGGTGIERCPYPRRYDVARNWDPQCRGCNGKGWLYEVWR
jgi:integrase